MSEFYSYFKENMEGLGLPAPETLFGTLETAVVNATVILSQIDKFGRAVTIGELLGAGTRLEGLGVAAACSAAFYVWAVIGSIAVASGRSLAGGTTIADVLFIATQYRLNRPWLVSRLHQLPKIDNLKSIARQAPRHQAALA